MRPSGLHDLNADLRYKGERGNRISRIRLKRRLKKSILLVVAVIPVIIGLLIAADKISNRERKEEVFNYGEARKIVFNLPFNDEIYCGCPYRGNKLDLNRCTFRYKEVTPDAEHVDVEHIVPPRLFEVTFKRYALGDKRCTNRRGKMFRGRACLLMVSRDFRRIHNDLHNMHPAIRAIKLDRSNLPFCEAKTDKPMFTGCGIKTDGKCIEPRDSVKGNIARVYLYMADRYPNRIILDRDFLAMLKLWSEKDPVDKVECILEHTIWHTQGVHNKFVYNQCK